MDIPTFTLLMAIYIVSAGAITGAVWLATFLSTRGPRPLLWEPAAALAPGLLYAILFTLDPTDLTPSKSLSNFFAEPIWCGVVYGVLFAVRMAITRRWSRLAPAAAVTIVALGVLAAAVVFFATPTLPE